MVTFLLRVVVPDRPGMLGAVASALGQVEGDIVSVDVVERSPGLAVDDMVVELPSGKLPDALVTAAHSIHGVRVESIRPYAGSLDTQRELELIESMTAEPDSSALLLVSGLPRIFRAGWSLLLRPERRGAFVVATSHAAPAEKGETVTGLILDQLGRRARAVDEDRDTVPSALSALDTDLAATPLGDRIVLLGRPGGPAFRSSELARLTHLAGIAMTIAQGT
ncbi:MAG TPA: ACT domain-containing protein [Mycobacteriales bacterium]|nr:ACT domain-containing protein [Mycobacteriales bacterium]